MTKPQPSMLGRNDFCSCGSQKKFKKCCGQATNEIQPQLASAEQIAALWRQATQKFTEGNLSVAQASCDQIIKLMANHAEALHLRALIDYRQGNFIAALQFTQRAITAAPRQSGFYNSLGLIQKELGQMDEAEIAYRKAIHLDPRNALAYSNLGDLFYQPETFAEAAQCYQQALTHCPIFPEANNNFGLLLIKMQRYEEAIQHFVAAIEQRPDYSEAYYSLASVLRLLERVPDAQKVLEQAIRVKPDFAAAWNDLGVILLTQQKTTEALAAFAKAQELQPNIDRSYLNIGNIHYDRGEIEVALTHYQQAKKLNPTDALQLKMALCVPAVYDSEAHIQAERERLENDLARLSATNLHIKNSWEEIGLTPFYLSYQGQNEKETLSRIGDLFVRSAPELNFVAPHCLQPKPVGEPIHIGFLSSVFNRPHIVNRVMAGIIANWPRDRFRLSILHWGVPCADILRSLREGDRLIQLFPSQFATQQKIAAAELDILFYCDLGMEPWTYFLSFARLAPLQLTSGGHPITSGVPNVDYFLSSAIDEIPAAQAHYRERLIALAKRPVCYFPEPPATQPKTRADFGLSDDKRIYICPMTPYKLHPELDSLLGEILRTDGAGEIVFVENAQPKLWVQLKQRFARSMPDVFKRIRFLPHMPMKDFVQLLRVADVMLDPTKFNGGTTSLEALAVGTPIVTLPGEFLRQRSTYAMYNNMQMFDCVAQDKADYVRLATEIAQRPDYREHLQQKILARNAILFGQTDWIKDLSDYLLAEVIQQRTQQLF